MRNLSVYILLFFAVPFFSSCEQEATNVELPETTPKLVVGCFISPGDTAVVATVSESNPIFGNNHNNVNSLTLPEAVVKISDGVNSAQLTYDSFEEEFRINTSQFPIVAGQSYYLDVSAPNVKSLPVTSSCTVPSTKVSSASATIEQGTESEILEITWPDLPGTSYYKVFVEYAMALNGDTIYYPGDSRLYDDEGNNGTMTSRINIYYRIGDDFVDWNGSGEIYKVAGYNIMILNTETNYYKYFWSLQNYTYDDPFAEPSPVFSNIKDGLGVFCGFNTYQFMKY